VIKKTGAVNVKMEIGGRRYEKGGGETYGLDNEDIRENQGRKDRLGMKGRGLNATLM